MIAGCGAGQKVDPEGSEKQYLLGADYFGKGMVRPALEELLKAVKLNPQNPEAHNLLGLISLRQAADSEALLEQQNCLKGEEAALLRQEMDSHFHEAEASFQKATGLRPDFSEAWNNLAVVHLHFQRWDQAVMATEKALSNALFSQPFLAQGNLAWALYHRREFARAAKELKMALFANPQFCVGRYRLAKLLYDQKAYDLAAEELSKVVTDPKCPIQEAQHLYGMVQLRLGDRTRASEAFSHCVEMAPKSCLAKECQIANL